VVLAVSFARIHRANLINFGIVPIMISAQDQVGLEPGNRLYFPSFAERIKDSETLSIVNKKIGKSFTGKLLLSARERRILLAGGLLNLVRGFSQ